MLNMVKEVNRLPTAVEKQLECPVCLLKFRTPKLLECMHTFCQECVLNLSKHSRLGGLIIRCPTCRQKTKVVDVTKLHNNFIVQGIIDSLSATMEENKKALSLQDKSKTGIKPKTEKYLSFSGCYVSDTSSTPSTPESTNSRNMRFSFAPSFNFGDISKTSFAEQRTPRDTSNNNKQCNDSGFDFSPFASSSPAISFQSDIQKTSFSPPLFFTPSSTNHSNSVQVINPPSTLSALSVRSTDKSPFSPNFDISNLSWGSYEKTSFAS